MLRCFAIIVTYNSGASIGPCLEALAREDCEIVLVDNASHDETVARVEEFVAWHPVHLVANSENLGFAAAVNQGARESSGDCLVDNASHDETVARVEEFVAWHPVHLVANSENLGFAAAVNQGARESSGDVLLVLNSDAIAEPGAVKALLQCLETSGAVAAGGALLDDDGQPARGFAFRRLPTLASLLCEVMLVNQLWPHNPVNRSYRCLDADYSQQQEVEQPAGACLAITRAAWESVGGFDEQFFPVWFEDVDLCKRLLERSGKIVYCPTARFRHSGGHSVGQLPFRDKQMFWLRYARKHFSSGQVATLRA